MKQISLVTDTHPLTRYLLRKHNKLSKKVLEVFRMADAGEARIYVPTPVVWEMMILCKKRKITPVAPFSVWIGELLARPGFQMLPLEQEDFVIALDLAFTTDELDALIVANAIRLGGSLITNDSVLHEAKPCKLFW